MKTPFVRGMAFIACISNVQAMEPTQGIKKEHYSDISEMKQILARELKQMMGTDKNGKQISIKFKTDQDIRMLAQRMGEIMDEKDFEPAFYFWAALEACDLALPPEDFKYFNFNTENYLIFDDVIAEACLAAGRRSL